MAPTIASKQSLVILSDDLSNFLCAEPKKINFFKSIFFAISEQVFLLTKFANFLSITPSFSSGYFSNNISEIVNPKTLSPKNSNFSLLILLLWLSSSALQTGELEYYLDNKDRFNINVDDKSYALLENSESFNLFSKIWTIDDFMRDGMINYDNVTKFERDISVYMTMISNVIKQLNDFALSNGINKESIDKRLDQVNRLSDILNSELEKLVTDYKLVMTEEDDSRLLKYARSLGLDAYTYQYIKEQFVFTLNWEGKEAKVPNP